MINSDLILTIFKETFAMTTRMHSYTCSTHDTNILAEIAAMNTPSSLLALV